MKHFLPLFITTLGVLLSVGLLTAYRSGLLAKVAERARRHTEELAVEVQESA
jgi:hypothetical protein